MPKRLAMMAVVAGLVLSGPAKGSAQTPWRGQITAILGAYHVDSDHVLGTAPGVGVAGGVRLTPRVHAEVELVRPASTFFREYTGTSVSFAGPGASREEIERLAVVTRFSYERRVLYTFSGGVVFHARARGRWTPLFYAGVTNQHIVDVSRRVPIRLPEGVDPAKLAKVLPEEERHVRNLGALTGGFGLSLALTPRLSIVPDLRIDYGSIGDEIENAIRPSIRFTWFF